MSKQHNFKFFLAAFLPATLGYQIQSVAVAWQVFEIRHSPFDLGLVGLAAFLPTIVLAVFAGYLADRFDRRKIALGAAVGGTVSALALVTLVLLGTRSISTYLIVLLCIGMIRALGSPAESTILVSIVPSAEYLNAVARYSASKQLIVVAGPAVGGGLVMVGAATAFGAAAACSTIAVVALSLLLIERRERTGSVPTLRGALDGIRFIVERKKLLGAMSLDLVAVLFGGATALLPVYAEILHWGPVGLGVLRSAPAFGAAVTGFVLARRPPRRLIGRKLLIAVAGFGLGTIAFGLSTMPWLSVIALVVVGSTDMVSVVIREGLMQLNTPDAMRGRVNAAKDLFVGASNQLGAFESGTLAALTGTVPAVVAGGAAAIVMIGLWMRFFPELIKVDRYVEA